jgi:hypothetical protein
MFTFLDGHVCKILVEVFEHCQLMNRSHRRPRPRSPKTNEKIEDEDDDENELVRTDNSLTLPILVRPIQSSLTRSKTFAILF